MGAPLWHGGSPLPGAPATAQSKAKSEQLVLFCPCILTRFISSVSQAALSSRSGSHCHHIPSWTLVSQPVERNSLSDRRVSSTGPFPVAFSGFVFLVCVLFFGVFLPVQMSIFYFFLLVLTIGQMLQSLIVPLSNYKCPWGNFFEWNAAEVRKALEVIEK